MIPLDDGFNEDLAADSWDSRTRRLIGDEAAGRLEGARVLVVGMGGVGGYAAEMLVRSGVGHISMIDADEVAVSNINRQLVATHSSVGMPKVLLYAMRFHDINPCADLRTMHAFLTADNIEEVLSEGYDFVIDAIDTVAPKTALLSYCMRRRIPVISSMGAGGRVDASKVGYLDLWQTANDGLAKAVRTRLRKEGIRGKLKVVASSEIPAARSLLRVNTQNKLTSLGTLAPVTATFGILLANYAIRKIAGI